MSETNKPSRIRGILAITLGVVGSLLAVAALVVSILFVVGANNIVDGIEERITQPIDRVDRQIEETSAAVSTIGAGELNARLASIADQATSAEAGLEAITEHPLYSRVPVDVAALESRLNSVVEQAGELRDESVGEPSGADRERIGALLDEVAAPLDGVEQVVQHATDSLRFWIRLSGLAFVLLALWGLWAQVSLAREGRRAFSKQG